jgi:serine/threonine protein kinase/Flp pilus assembly protein TadD
MNPPEASRAAGAHPGSGATRDDPRVLRAVEEYLAALEAGQPPPRAEFLARHADVADRLGEYLDGLDLVHRAASAVGPITDGEADEVSRAEPLGDFRLLREVGRGGMGVVYEAEQVSLGRRVALKVLPFAATMDLRQLQRFHNEARAAAALDHPHIVHVHAVGCERGVHYYAMQFIEGQTLAALIAELRQAGGPPARANEQLTTPHIPGQPASTERGPRDRAYFRRVAELGIQAAEALDHAHALGVVHRDVKPANLLVDGRGGLWVTDFGLAHIQSDARLRLTGDLVGTLRYLSPEQALAKRVPIDHRTDVYSLGATLYELLTLAPAFPGSDRQELLRQIAFEEPKPPRRANKAIPAELETVVLKALEKNPAERYATAKELADDLQRFLADEPIRARPAGVIRQLRKWGRRHQAWVAATAGLALVLLVLGGVVFWREQWQRAAAANAIEAALERAQFLQQQEHWDEALAVLALAQGQLEGHRVGALRERMERSRRDVEMLRKLEDAHLQMAALGKEMGFDYAGADRLYAAAFADYDLDMTTLGPREAAERIQASAICDRLIAALDDWVPVWQHLRPRDRDPLRAVAELVEDDPWRRRLRAVKRPDQERAVLEALANEKDIQSRPLASVRLLAISLWNAGSGAMAEQLLRQAQATRSADFWVNFDLAFILEKKGADPAEALRFYQAALALRPQSPVVHNNLGTALSQKGNLNGAIAEYKKAIDIDAKFAMPHFNLGNSLRTQGHLDEAIAEYRKAIDLKPNDPAAPHNLGLALSEKGNPDGAVSAYKKAIDINPKHVYAYNGLGDVLRHKGDVAGAIAACRKAIDPRYATAYITLGAALSDKKDVAGAIAAFHKAIDLDKDRADAHRSLGAVLLGKGDMDGAIAAFREAIRCNKDYAEAHYGLGLAALSKGQFAEALIHLRSGHELGSKTPRWPYPSAQWVKKCERLVELDAKLPRILKAEVQPADAGERLALAQICQMHKSLYAAAVRFDADAFAEQPKLADDLQGQPRYNAACAAALAGCGQGEDAVKLTDAERAGFRKQALDWLRADLESWRRLLDKEPDRARPLVLQNLCHWLEDTDFAGVRGAEVLKRLPEAKRADWQRLWDHVEALRQRATAAPPPGAPVQPKN